MITTFREKKRNPASILNRMAHIFLKRPRILLEEEKTKVSAGPFFLMETGPKNHDTTSNQQLKPSCTTHH